VLIEAMAAGTAIVASDLPGYAKVARSGRDALLVEPGDPRVLAKALGRLLGDEGERRRLIAEGSTRAEQFSMRVQAEAYMARYERLIGT
jgi:phosphatidylinositol alpha-mannosyltransferase